MTVKNISNLKSVLFVTSQLRQREIKMAHALRSLGWEVSLIYYKSTPFDPNNHFNFVCEVQSAEQAYKYAQVLKPKLIHVFSGAIDNYIHLFCKNKIAPVVIDLNDVFTSCLMDYCPERYEPTKEALGLADGFCARDLQVKAAERFDNCQLPPHILFYPEYCWNDKRTAMKEKVDDEIHIVSVGTISLETHGMYDCCYLELVRRIIDQNIHFHMFPPWHYRKDHNLTANINFERDYAQFLQLEKVNPYLHIHDSLPVEELAQVLPQYDFGIISGGCEAFGQTYTHFKPKYVETCYSGRITDYLDARLPILINDEVAFDYWLLDRYKVCLNLKEILQPGFKEKLIAFKQSDTLQKDLDIAMTKLSIATNASRIANFYSHIISDVKCQGSQNTNPSLMQKLISKIFLNKQAARVLD